MTLVHIHSFILARHRPRLGDAPAMLSADERRRAARCKVDAAREEFVLSRLLLRHLLGRVLDRPAATLDFAYGPWGKPRLPGSGLEFNASHSHGRLLVALCRDRPVGIDIERLRPDIDPVGLAQAGLPEADQQRVRDTAPGDRMALFFQLWTRHEARLKTLGLGLAGHGETDAAPMAVTVHDLEVDPDFRAAVAWAAGADTPRLCRHDD